VRRAARLGDAAGNLAERGNDRFGAVGGAGDIVGNLAGRELLLLDGNGNGAGVGADVLHPPRDFADGRDRLAA